MKNDKHFLKNAMLLIMSLLTLGANHAQTLEQLSREALQNNPQLKALNLDYQAGLEKALQVNELPDPEIGLGYFLFPVETRVGAQQFRLGLTQMFPWFGTLQQRENLALAQARPLQQALLAARLDIAFQVKGAWLVLYELNARENIVNKNIRLLEALERLALRQIESGRGRSADALQVQIQINELNNQLELLKTQKAKPFADLEQLLNRSVSATVGLPDTLPLAVLPLQKDTLLQKIKRRHPMIRMYELQELASEESLKLNELDGKPSFGIGLDYTTVNNRQDANPEQNGRDIFQIRASIQLPIFRKKYAAKERQERLQMQAIDQRKQNTANEFTAVLEKAYIDHEEAALQLDLYQQQTQQLRSVIRLLQADYAAGQARMEEVLQTEKELLNYELKILQAIVQSHQARITIERLSGFDAQQ